MRIQKLTFSFPFLHFLSSQTSTKHKRTKLTSSVLFVFYSDVAFDSLLVFPKPFAFFPSLNPKQNPKSNGPIQIFKQKNQRERGKGAYHLFHEAESSGLFGHSHIAERGFRSGHALCRVVFAPLADDPQSLLAVEE